MSVELAEELIDKCINVALNECKEGQYPLGAMVVDENGEYDTIIE